MNTSVLRECKRAATVLLSLFMLIAASQAAFAQGKSDQAPGRNRNLGHNNASDGVKGLISSNRQVFLHGDPLEIHIRFPRGAALIASGEVDAFLLIFTPGADTIVLPVSNVASEVNAKLFDIAAVDVEKLPPGVYQLGLVITVPGGDPLNVNDWYNGLLGLITVRGLTVGEEPLDIDVDGDGVVDNDMDGDGFEDEEEMEDEMEEENGMEEEMEKEMQDEGDMDGNMETMEP